jgi:membrane associated rhomboid family serine protease
MRPSRRQTQPFTRRWSPGRPSITVLLVALHVGAFGSQWLLQLIEQDRYPTVHWLWHWLALGGSGIAAGQYWQFFTFGLLHDGPVHLAVNLLLLYFAGRQLEPIIGARAFVGLYILGNVLGGVTHWLAMPGFALVGASAGVAAVVAAYATVLPELELPVNLFFVVPLRLRAKLIGFAVLAVGLVCWIMKTIPHVGPAAIVAGCVVGCAFARQLGFGNPLAVQRYLYKRRERAARLQRMSADQFVREEIDPILDKIAREGVQRLTRAERRTLALGREKIVGKTGVQ